MIKTVWLDNPPVNAVNGGIIETLWTALEELGDDVRAVVLRGRASARSRRAPTSAASSAASQTAIGPAASSRSPT